MYALLIQFKPLPSYKIYNRWVSIAKQDTDIADIWKMQRWKLPVCKRVFPEQEKRLHVLKE
jgi:hypothetical protein